MATLDMRDFNTLDELRVNLLAYVRKYNLTPHTSLAKKIPSDRFFSESNLIVRLDEEKIEKDFLIEIERRVSADSVIVIDQVEYEVDYRFARQRIRLRYSPDMERIFVVASDGTLIKFVASLVSSCSGDNAIKSCVQSTIFPLS